MSKPVIIVGIVIMMFASGVIGYLIGKEKKPAWLTLLLGRMKKHWHTVLALMPAIPRSYAREDDNEHLENKLRGEFDNKQNETSATSKEHSNVRNIQDAIRILCERLNTVSTEELTKEREREAYLKVVYDFKEEQGKKWNKAVINSLPLGDDPGISIRLNDEAIREVIWLVKEEKCNDKKKWKRHLEA